MLGLRLPTSTATLLVCLLLLLCWSLGLRTGAQWGATHWFYIPILYAGIRFGAFGAAFTALAAALLAGPMLPADAVSGLPQELDFWLIRSAVFLLVGEIAAVLIHPAVAEEERLEPHMQLAAHRHEQAERIRHVIEEDRLAVHFQPIVELSTGRVVGMESLSRFPQDSPEPWFATAWEVGLGPELEIAALCKAVDEGLGLPKGMFQAVNLSPEVLLSERFDDVIRSVPWIRLVVEMTEHVMVEDYQRLSQPLAEIRSRGGQIAIDDVGAGFASLRHVVSLSPDIVKLDVSLWRGVHMSQPRLTLARGVIACADELRAVVVAEGVERPEEAEALQGVGASYGQGFLFGHPAPLGPRRILYLPDRDHSESK
jgi:EAL domain-containing protein (putative c-di-GMP-specific phosphodiesterase class I)